MTREKLRSTSHRLVEGVVGVVMLAVALVAWAEPASAHTNAQAIKYGCGDSYRLVREAPMIGGSGSKVGALLLARVPGTSTYCAVTRKIASHNTPHGHTSASPTTATLWAIATTAATRIFCKRA
jgi:hypothetical protein